MSGPLLEEQFNQIINYIQSQMSDREKIKKIKIESENSDDDSSKIVLNKSKLIYFENSPSIEVFRQEYFLKNIPVIIDNQMNHWPAMNKWRFCYFKF